MIVSLSGLSGLAGTRYCYQLIYNKNFTFIGNDNIFRCHTDFMPKSWQKADTFEVSGTYISARSSRILKINGPACTHTCTPLGQGRLCFQFRSFSLYIHTVVIHEIRPSDPFSVLWLPACSFTTSYIYLAARLAPHPGRKRMVHNPQPSRRIGELVVQQTAASRKQHTAHSSNRTNKQ